MARKWHFNQSLLSYHFKHRGFKGVFDLLATRFVYTKLRWLTGKYIESRGSIIKIDGCQISLDTPLFSTKRKASFLGQHEIYERIAIYEHLNPTLPVIEFGAGMGVVACVTNKLLINPQKHVVVEPNPMVIPLLEANRELNACQFTIIPAALAYDSDLTDLHTPGSILGSNTIQVRDNAGHVPTITLERIMDKFEPHQVTVICDIEGGEVDLVAREAEVLKNRVDMLIMELHPHLIGHDDTHGLTARLNSLGFEKIDETYPSSQGAYVGVFRNKG